MAVHDFFEVGGEIRFQCGLETQFFRVRLCQSDGFGEKTAARRFRRADDGHGAGIVLDHDFRPLAHAVQQGSEIVRRVSVRYMDDALYHAPIIPRLGEAELPDGGRRADVGVRLHPARFDAYTTTSYIEVQKQLSENNGQENQSEGIRRSKGIAPGCAGLGVRAGSKSSRLGNASQAEGIRAELVLGATGRAQIRFGAGNRSLADSKTA